MIDLIKCRAEIQEKYHQQDYTYDHQGFCKQDDQKERNYHLVTISAITKTKLIVWQNIMVIHIFHNTNRNQVLHNFAQVRLGGNNQHHLFVIHRVCGSEILYMLVYLL